MAPRRPATPRALPGPAPAPGGPVPAKAGSPTAGRKELLPELPLWAQFVRLGGSLTPQIVSGILLEADTGHVSRFVDLANESRQKDATLQQGLQQRETAVAGLPWKLVYPGLPADSTEGAEELAFVEEALRGIFDLPRFIAHLTGAVYLGFAVTEIRWRKRLEDDRLVPLELVHHSQRRFGFRQADGRLVWRDDGTDDAGVDFREKWPDRFVVAQPRVNGDVPAREGLARLLVWAALFRNWSLADWLRLGEIAWKPWRVGTYQKLASDEDIEKLTGVLERMTATGQALVPETTKLEVMWPGGGQAANKPGHGDIFSVLGAEMSKAMVGQTLTSEQGKVGSQALGRVHNEVRKDLVDADALYDSAVVTRDLVEPIVRLNFGTAARVPAFCLHREETKDLSGFATAVATLANVGTRFSQKWVRNEMAAPEPEGAEETIPAPLPQPPAQPGKPGNDPGDGDE